MLFEYRAGRKETGTNPIHLKKLGLLMANGMGFPNTPGEVARAQGFLEVLRNSSPLPWHFSFQTCPGPARRGLSHPRRWPTCFALQRGSRGRLPFASGEAVKVPPPSLALCPRRPDGISSCGRPTVSGPPTFVLD